MFQIFGVFNYNGLNIFDNKQIILALKEENIKLFSIILSVNSIIVGILWVYRCILFGSTHKQQ